MFWVSKAKVSSKDEQKQVFIPFVLENGIQTNAMLIARLSGGDTLYHLLYGKAYKKYGFDRNVKDRWTAREVFTASAIFDNEIFGHEKFVVKDDRLLGADSNDPGNAPANVTMKDSIAGQNARTQTIRYFIHTVTWVICEECPDYARTTDEECCNATYYTDVVNFWFDDGFGGGPSYEWGWFPPEGGGGGGGVPCPGCNWDNTNPCEEQDPNQPQFPCDQDWRPTVNANIFDYYHEWGYTHFETWTVSTEDDFEIDDWAVDNIDTTGLDSCRRIILRKLLGSISGNNVLGKMLAKLERSIFETNNLEKFKWKFHTEDLSGSGTNANTDTILYTGNVYTAITVLDSTRAKTSTDLFIAATLLHEAIHAYMVITMLRVKNGATLANLQAMTYDSLFNEFIDTLTARNAPALTNQSFPQDYQHNYMQRKLLDAIAEALKDFDGNAINDDEYYWYMAWKGLYKTDAWLQHWPNYFPTTSNYPIVGAPYTTDDSTRGLKYALTPSRLVNIINSITHERNSDSVARGRKPVLGGCY